MAKKSFGVGDWVRIHLPGIWQVARIQPIVCRDPATGDATNRTALFVSRIATKLPKKSFSAAVCDISLARAALKSDVAKMEKLPELLAEFNAYDPPVIDAVYNVAFAKPSKASKSELAKKFKKESPMTEFEIHALCDRLKLELGYREWTAQFIARDHEIDDANRLLYQFSQIDN